jgi:integrase
MRRFGLWLDTERPQLESLAELTRADMVDFMEAVRRLRKIKHPDEPISSAYRAGIISTAAVLFRHAALFEWDDVPARPLITHADMPHGIQRVPRFIPGHKLDPVMERIRSLECPLQRCALLTARWSGARRTEIRKLHLDCLDAYPDGTPRLRLAAGKALRERSVPLHEEAAQAICDLVKTHEAQGTKESTTPTWDGPYATCSCATASRPTPTTCSPGRSGRSARNWRSSTARASPPSTPTGSATPSAPSWPRRAPAPRPS